MEKIYLVLGMASPLFSIFVIEVIFLPSQTNDEFIGQNTGLSVS